MTRIRSPFAIVAAIRYERAIAKSQKKIGTYTAPKFKTIYA